MLRPRSLFWKLSALILAILLAVILIISLQWRHTRGHTLMQIRADLLLQSTELAAKVVEHEVFNDASPEAYQSTLRQTFRTSPNLSVTLFDGDGQILAQVRPPQTFAFDRARLRWTLRRKRPGVPFLVNPPGPRPNFGVQRIRGTHRPPLFVAVTQAVPPEAQMSRGRLPPWISVPLVLFITSGVAGLLGIRMITRRLRKLEEGVERLAKGDLSARVDPGPDDEIGRLCTSFNGMAESLQEAMDEVSSQDSARRDILADVSHELRTPLTSLMCQVELLQESEDSLSPVQKRRIAILAEEGRSLSRRVEDLLVLAREEARPPAVERRPINLQQLLQDLCNRQKDLFARREVELTTAFVPEIVQVEGDRERLMQVFQNLLHNALACLSSGGKVHLRVVPGDRKVDVQVEDNGPGIPADELEHIFDRFHRGRGRRGGGTGLGLAIVKRFTSHHDGECRVESTVGKGSCFTVTLPVNGDRHHSQPGGARTKSLAQRRKERKGRKEEWRLHAGTTPGARWRGRRA